MTTSNVTKKSYMLRKTRATTIERIAFETRLRGRGGSVTNEQIITGR